MTKQVSTIVGPFDQHRYEQLKQAYQQAVEDGQQTFGMSDFAGEFRTDFAKYLIEFLEQEFGTPENLVAVRSWDGTMWVTGVMDVEDGLSVWWPSDTARDEIEQSSDPRKAAVAMCDKFPMRGEWSN